MALRPLAVLPIATLCVACDPGAGVSARVALSPAPRVACIDSALSRSPLVAEVSDRSQFGPADAPPRFQATVRLRDTTVHLPANATLRYVRDTAEVRVTFMWV